MISVLARLALALFIDTLRLRLVRAAQLPCFGRAGDDPNADGVHSYRALWIQSHEVGFTSPEGICSLVDSRLGASTSPPLFATKRGPSTLDPSFSRGEVLLLPHRVVCPADRTKHSHEQDQSNISALRSPTRRCAILGSRLPAYQIGGGRLSTAGLQIISTGLAGRFGVPRRPWGSTTAVRWALEVVDQPCTAARAITM